MNESKEQLINPELKINQDLIAILGNLERILIKKGKIFPLESKDNKIFLKSGDKELAQITNNNFLVVGKNLTDKLRVGDKEISNSELSLEKINNFFESISDHITRLNHLGINYFCEDMETETQKIKELANSKGFKLYSESYAPKNQRWLFVGDVSNWKNPLFEIVLNEGKPGESDEWKPHFQIDIDTNLPIEEIKKKIDQSLGEKFIKWQLDIPNFGTVLGMGIIGKENETKIALGIGTNKRNTQIHRTEELKEI